MKRICLIIFITTVLCLTACGAGKNNETSESSNAASENALDKAEVQEKTAGEIEKSTSGVNESEPQFHTEKPFELTEQGKDFLRHMCIILSDFDSKTKKDEAFWRDFLFYSYTDASEGAEIEQIYREDFGYDETVSKVSLQEAKAYAKLIFGIDMPDIKPSFDDMEEGQTSCYYQDGYYYIGVSDFPNEQYNFVDYEESGDSITVRYTIDFDDESNIGTVCFTLVPEANENGFIIVAKTTEFSN